MHRVNYDQIAHRYDEPQRDHILDPDLLAFVEANGRSLPSSPRILDVGCGTGKQLAANHRQFPHMTMVGVDRFEGMLRIARKRCPGATWVQADGAHLPLTSESCLYATSQFSYPHIRERERLVAEVFRVLEPGGRFVVTNIDPWSMTGWAIYRYFPEALALDRQDFLPVDELVSLMRSAGFRDLRTRRADLSQRETLPDFLAYASTRYRASQLMAISDRAYVAGIRALEIAIEEARGQDTTFDSEFALVTIMGDKP